MLSGKKAKKQIPNLNLKDNVNRSSAYNVPFGQTISMDHL